MSSFVLHYVVKTVNEIEYGFILNKVSYEESAQRLRGIEILLKNMLEQYKDDPAGPQIERELVGVRFLAELCDTLKTHKETSLAPSGSSIGHIAATREVRTPNLDWFQIDCKCGEEYITQLPAAFHRANCRNSNCGESVFVDRSRGKTDTEKGPAWIATNKYFVPKGDNAAVPDEVKRLAVTIAEAADVKQA